MSVCIVFHSETGNTRTIAERLAPLVGGDLIEVTDLAHYSKISRYISGGRRAMKGESATIEPATIDVTACDTVVVGTPVWAGNPTPAINAAIEALAPFLSPGEISLGNSVQLQHSAPSPVGASISCTARVVRAEGKRILFQVEASQGTKNIARGLHYRTIIRADAFAARLSAPRP